MNQLNPVDSALREAVLSNSAEKIRDYCKNYNINHINKEGFTALHLAIIHVKDNALAELISCGADTNLQTQGLGPYDGIAPIHVAVRGENYFALDLLLKNPNTKIDQKNRAGFTAFHQAVMCGDGKAFNMILDISPSSYNVKVPLFVSVACMAGIFGYSEQKLKQGIRYHPDKPREVREDEPL